MVCGLITFTKTTTLHGMHLAYFLADRMHEPHKLQFYLRVLVVYI